MAHAESTVKLCSVKCERHLRSDGAQVQEKKKKRNTSLLLFLFIYLFIIVFAFFASEMMRMSKVKKGKKYCDKDWDKRQGGVK